MKITKDSTLEEILNHPEGRKIMAKYEVPCLGCPMAAMEMKDLKIKEIADKYDLDLKSILDDLNHENK